MTTYSNIRYAAAGVTEYATADDLPTTAASGSQAFVAGTNRLYIWNGTGWYNIALINTNPTISGVSSSYALATDGTATTVTITASDPEGIPITYSLASDTSGNTATVVQGTGASTNVFTITPSTSSADVGTFTLTFRASDGVNLATAPAEFSLAFSVANSHYTSALITSVGGNNAVNNTFIDSSSNSNTITTVGDAHQTTFSPYRHGGYSTYFDGSGDYLKTASSSTFNLYNTAFTIEGWFYATAPDTGEHLLSSYINSSNRESLYFSNSTTLSWWVNGSIRISATVAANEWYHVAIVDNGGTTTMYIDGTSQGTWASTYTDGNRLVWVGTYNDGAYAPDSFTGYISDWRVVKGTAITPSSGGPIERLTAVANTSLLTCHLPYIADGSTNSHAITISGNTSTQPFSPYDYSQYSSAANGGSMSFDGTGDYLTISNSSGDFTFGTGDFTVETWVYYDAMPSGSGYPNSAWILGGGPVNSNTGFDIAVGSTNIQIGLSSFASLNINAAHGMSAGRWYHLAVVRNGNTLTCYKDGSSLATADVTGVTADAMATGIAIAAAEPSGATSGNPNGYYSDVRVVKGTAVYTANFTPPTVPLAAITNTSLLLRGTNAGIIDKSQTAQAITLNGNAKSSTTVYKYLTSSMAFDGSGDYVSMPSDASFGLGTGDFTIEWWAYQTATSSYAQVFAVGYGAGGIGAHMRNNGDITVSRPGTAIDHTFTANLSSSGSIWYHIALVRNGSTLTCFVNGTSVGTATNSTNYAESHLNIGIDGNNSSSPFQGYISDFRITKGLARYTSAFTPPTAALKG